MNDGSIEIPDRDGKQEALPPATKETRRLYMAVIVVLGAVLLIGVAGWLLLVANDHTMPDGLVAILGTVAGGLVGLITAESSGGRRD